MSNGQLKATVKRKGVFEGEFLEEEVELGGTGFGVAEGREE